MSAATCPQCDRPVRGGAKFCAACGRALPASALPASALPASALPASALPAAAACRFCGAALRPGARYCPSCGRSAAPTEQVSPPAGPPSRRVAWRAWTTVALLAFVVIALAALVLWLALQFQPVNTIMITPDIAATLTAVP